MFVSGSNMPTTSTPNGWGWIQLILGAGAGAGAGGGWALLCQDLAGCRRIVLAELCIIVTSGG
jgi:hypothetical protein